MNVSFLNLHNLRYELLAINKIYYFNFFNFLQILGFGELPRNTISTERSLILRKFATKLPTVPPKNDSKTIGLDNNNNSTSIKICQHVLIIFFLSLAAVILFCLIKMKA